MTRASRLATASALVALTAVPALADGVHAVQGQTTKGGNVSLTLDASTFAPRSARLHFALHCINHRTVFRDADIAHLRTVSVHRAVDADGTIHTTFHVRKEGPGSFDLNLSGSVTARPNQFTEAHGSLTVADAVHGVYCDTGVLKWGASGKNV
jgi:hypothetical protein